MIKNTHPTRKELILAVRLGGADVGKHLTDCSWCHLYFGLLTKYPLAGELPFSNAPLSWIEKAISIAAKPDRARGLKSLIARISFDSWARPVPEGVRGEALILERRLRFDAANKTFDLRAEYRQNHWDFTAQITDREGKIVDGTLLAGKKELNADEQGFYQWSSVRPPQKVKLLTDEDEIEIPELSWKKSRPE